MKVQEVPEEFREYIKGYVIDDHRGSLIPFFVIDKEDDYLVYDENEIDTLSDICIDKNEDWITDELKELIVELPNFKFDHIYAEDVEFIITKEVFESDLYKVIYTEE